MLILSGIPVMLVFGFGIYRQIIQGVKFGNNPMSDTGLIVSSILVLLLFLILLLLFGILKLSTEIDRQGIRYRFYPFQMKFRKLRWDDVRQVEVITYNPIRDYGGWGIKSGKKGKAYNVSGNKGMQIQLRDGRNVLIGTQNHIELADFLMKMNKNKPVE